MPVNAAIFCPTCGGPTGRRRGHTPALRSAGKSAVCRSQSTWGRFRMRPSIDASAATSEERAANKGVTLRRLLGEMRPYRGRVGAALAFVLVTAVAQALGP